MSSKTRAIQGKGDWEASPPTGMNDGDVYHIGNDIVASGGTAHLMFGDSLVEEDGTPGMFVRVNPGTIYVDNAAWTLGSFEPRYYQVVRDALETVPISSNPSGSTRYDVVCQFVDKVTPPNDNADNVCPIEVVEGTPGGGVPAIPDEHEPLAIVEVVDGATAITDSDIQDVRRQMYLMPNSTNSGVQIVADAATVTFDLNGGQYNKFFVSVTNDRTFAVANAPVGLPFLVMVQQGTGAPNAPTWWNDILWPDGAAPDWSTTLGAIDTFGFILLESGDFMGYLVGSNSQ